VSQPLRPGFKAQAERIALELRAELGLAPDDRLAPAALAAHLAIPVLALDDLRDEVALPASVERLSQPGAAFSALTVCAGPRRLIVYNPRHPPGRRANSLAHELAHIILEHPPAPPLDQAGRRLWHDAQEAEADWQAAALLVPREGALAWLRRERGPAGGERHFGVSRALFLWRLHQTGAARQFNLATRRALRGGGRQAAEN
jgi:hypothetical protein